MESEFNESSLPSMQGGANKNESRLRAASMLSKQLRDQKKKVSKVFKYFTGDEFDEFERDFAKEELEGLSESELATKEELDSEEGNENSKKS